MTRRPAVVVEQHVARTGEDPTRPAGASMIRIPCRQAGPHQHGSISTWELETVSSTPSFVNVTSESDPRALARREGIGEREVEVHHGVREVGGNTHRRQRVEPDRAVGDRNQDRGTNSKRHRVRVAARAVSRRAARTGAREWSRGEQCERDPGGEHRRRPYHVEVKMSADESESERARADRAPDDPSSLGRMPREAFLLGRSVLQRELERTERALGLRGP
jgi:hypothetical protein